MPGLTVAAQSPQGAERQQQTHDPLLPAADGAAAAPAAGSACLRISLLLRHAGRGPVHPLGLEELRGAPRDWRGQSFKGMLLE